MTLEESKAKLFGRPTTQKQRDGGLARAIAEHILGKPVRADQGNFVSGGQFQNFRTGWARAIFPSKQTRAHYFERDAFDKATSLCGIEADVRWLYGPGNYPECSRCIEKRCKR